MFLSGLSDIRGRNVLRILAFLLTIRLFVFFIPALSDELAMQNMSHIDYLFSLLNPNKFLSYILSTGLVFLTALALNNVVNQHEVLFKKGYLTAYFFCICSSFFPEYATVSPIMVVNLIMVLAMQRIFELYKAPFPIDNVFLAGLLAGVCMLFSANYFPLYLYTVVAIIFFRNTKPREITASLFGFLLPVFLASSTHYFFYESFFYAPLLWPTFQFNQLLDYVFRPPFLVTLTIVLLATARVARNFWRNNIKNRRVIQLLYLYIGMGFLLTIITKTNAPIQSMLMALPLSVLMAYYFTPEQKLGRFKQILHVILLLSTFVYQYAFLFIKT